MTLQRRWTHQFLARPLQRLSIAGPLVVGEWFARQRETGDIVWSRDTLAGRSGVLYGRVWGVVDGFVVVVPGGYPVPPGVLVLRADTAEVLWEDEGFELAGVVHGAVASVDGVLRDLFSGTLLCRLETRLRVLSAGFADDWLFRLRQQPRPHEVLPGVWLRRARPGERVNEYDVCRCDVDGAARSWLFSDAPVLYEASRAGCWIQPPWCVVVSHDRENTRVQPNGHRDWLPTIYELSVVDIVEGRTVATASLGTQLGVPRIEAVAGRDILLSIPPPEESEEELSPKTMTLFRLEDASTG
jgi:hypothetical protein